jgi:NAD(P)-dependent dehydrogenase (short-subunit alcohol dehydrogenase family)
MIDRDDPTGPFRLWASPTQETIMIRFENQTVLITGAGSGLGRAAAVQVAKEGARLALVDLSQKGLEETEQAIKTAAPDAQVLLVTGDVSREEAVAAFVRQTQERFSSIDAFFNNAGIEGKQNLTEEYSVDEFARVISINLNGVFFGLKHVLPVMRAQGHGRVVNTASVGGIQGVGNQSGYAASKHGVVGLTRNSAIEYGEHGISINAIAPGAIMTAMVEGSLKQIDPVKWEAAGQQFVQANPMKRFGRPEEVGYLVAFLLSDQASFINAAVVPIDRWQSAKY